jgi:CMP-N-acetylneuraminic acid synthetase
MHDSGPEGPVLALIPARGGSKSIARKNLRPLGGHPLLAWSVAAAQQSRHVGRVLVSTDDEEIREAALAYGAEAPFLRPAELAADDTPDLPVFRHGLDWLRAHGYRPGLVVHLRPTSPLRPPGLIDAAIDALRDDPFAHAIRTVCAPAQSPFKMWRLQGAHLKPLLGCDFPEPYNQPRQRLPPVFWQTGHVDVARRATLEERDSMTGSCIHAYLVDPSYAVDIDTLAQWAVAEQVLADGQLEVVRPGA